jgi:hypothetical protein
MLERVRGGALPFARGWRRNHRRHVGGSRFLLKLAELSFGSDGIYGWVEPLSDLTNLAHPRVPTQAKIKASIRGVWDIYTMTISYPCQESHKID